MPLFPVSTYSSWQLACIAAVEPFDPTHPDHVQSDDAIRAELRTRQIDDPEVEEMIALARRIGRRISPIVCMDVDDLERGIATQFDAGEIDTTERDRLLRFVAARVDSPRAQRHPSSRKPGAGSSGTLVAAYTAVGFTLVALAQSRLGFFVWLAGVFVVMWIQQSLPSWRNRFRRPRGNNTALQRAGRAERSA